MNQKFPRSLLSAIAALSLMLTFGGCATKDEIATKRKWETQEERADREVFHSNWLLPSVSEDEKEFFYRSFWKKQE